MVGQQDSAHTRIYQRQNVISNTNICSWVLPTLSWAFLQQVAKQLPRWSSGTATMTAWGQQSILLTPKKQRGVQQPPKGRKHPRILPATFSSVYTPGVRPPLCKTHSHWTQLLTQHAANLLLLGNQNIFSVLWKWRLSMKRKATQTCRFLSLLQPYFPVSDSEEWFPSIFSSTFVYSASLLWSLWQCYLIPDHTNSTFTLLFLDFFKGSRTGFLRPRPLTPRSSGCAASHRIFRNTSKSDREQSSPTRNEIKDFSRWSRMHLRWWEEVEFSVLSHWPTYLSHYCPKVCSTQSSLLYFPIFVLKVSRNGPGTVAQWHSSASG